MESKLTLKLDSGAISRAKKYITIHPGKSLSKLVENYFDSLTKSGFIEETANLPPIVSDLAGIGRKNRVKNVKDDYTDYLIEKYK